MAEYIERGALIRYVEKQEVIIKDGLSIADAVRIQGNVFRRAVETCPAADVVEVRHGEWLPHEIEQLVDPFINPHYNIETFRPLNYRCNLCGRIEERKEPYCNCGAKMDGKGEGE